MFYFRNIMKIAITGMMLTMPISTKASEEIDVALVLAIDVSTSTSHEQKKFQLEGYAEAIQAEEVFRALQSGYAQKIAVKVVFWASDNEFWEMTDWVPLQSKDDLENFSNQIVDLPYKFGTMTHIQSALVSSGKLFENIPYEPLKKVIDISSDGPSNGGVTREAALEYLSRHNIVVNGLPLTYIVNYENIDLTKYYSENVIFGPGAFLVPVNKKANFVNSLTMKLSLEIATIRSYNDSEYTN